MPPRVSLPCLHRRRGASAMLGATRLRLHGGHQRRHAPRRPGGVDRAVRQAAVRSCAGGRGAHRRHRERHPRAARRAEPTSERCKRVAIELGATFASDPYCQAASTRPALTRPPRLTSATQQRRTSGRRVAHAHRPDRLAVRHWPGTVSSHGTTLAECGGRFAWLQWRHAAATDHRDPGDVRRAPRP
jgi:hypothetical protein